MELILRKKRLITLEFMRKLQFFSFLIIILIISSCKTSIPFTTGGLGGSKPNSSRSGNLRSKDFKRGELKALGKFGSRTRSHTGTNIFVKESKMKSGPTFKSYTAGKRRTVKTAVPMKQYGSRDRNIKSFKSDSRNKTSSHSFKEYKRKKIHKRNPVPIKWSDKSDLNLKLFKSDIRKKTRYGPGRPSIHGKRPIKNSDGTFKQKTYIKRGNKLLFITWNKKSMHDYSLKRGADKSGKKKNGLFFWKNPKRTERRQSKREYKTLNRKKKKPEMELFDPKIKINRSN